MLNKELMLFTKAEKEPHIYMTVGQYRSTDEPTSGYYPDLGIGAISKIPVWETLSGALSIWALYEEYDFVHGTYTTYIQSKDKVKDQVRLNITIQGETFQGIYIVGMRTNSVPGDPFKLNTLVNKTVPVIFDPPPRLLFGSRYGQTYRVDYYVEEVPWEAQDAEQGTSDGGWCRGVVVSTTQSHRGLLYRSNPSIEHQSAAYHLGRNSEHGYCNGSNTSKEFPATFTKCRTLQGHNRRWVYSRRLLHTRNSNHIASKQGVSRGVLRSVTSKEALYA